MNGLGFDIPPHRISQIPQRHISDRFGQLTLPDHNHIPPQCLKVGDLLSVTLFVPPDFLLPELHIGTRHPKLLTPWMPMPETPIYEYHRVVLPQHNVRTPRQLPRMQQVPKTASMQVSPHHHLRPCVLPPDPRHAVMPLLPCHRVGHNISCLTKYHKNSKKKTLIKNNPSKKTSAPRSERTNEVLSIIRSVNISTSLLYGLSNRRRVSYGSLPCDRREQKQTHACSHGRRGRR